MRLVWVYNKCLYNKHIQFFSLRFRLKRGKTNNFILKRTNRRCHNSWGPSPIADSNRCDIIENNMYKHIVQARSVFIASSPSLLRFLSRLPFLSIPFYFALSHSLWSYSVIVPCYLPLFFCRPPPLLLLPCAPRHSLIRFRFHLITINQFIYGFSVGHIL